MRRFALEENIRHLDKKLGSEHDPDVLVQIRTLKRTSERDLALLNASEFGTCRRRSFFDAQNTYDDRALFFGIVSKYVDRPMPLMILDPRPGLHIVYANNSFCRKTFKTEESIIGRSLFDVFAPNIDETEADSIATIFASLADAFESQKPQTLPIQRHDIRTKSAYFEERHWLIANTPIIADDSSVAFIATRLIDVTDRVRCRATSQQN
jgi:PAS domain-containing protein